jgi:glycerol kinase
VAHIARAALESIAFQSAALLLAMSKDAAQGMAPETPPASASQGGAVGSARPVAITELRVDGGACVNDLLMQFQADLLGIPVVRPKVVETTALGAAYLAGLAVGAYRSLDELSAQWQVERRFLPTMPRERAAELMANWERAVRQATAT